MTTDPYSAQVRELFTATAHAGRLDGGEAVYLDEQDVRIRLTVTVDGGRVAAMRFEAWGCPHLIAAAEAACAALESRSVADLLEFSTSGLMDNLPVPVEKTGRILVLEDAVRSLGRRFRDES